MRISPPIAAVAVVAFATACSSLSGKENGSQAASPLPSPRLFLAGDSELWVVETGTGKVRHLRVPELSAGDAPYRILRRGNRLVLWGGATYVRNPNLAKPAVPLAEDAGFFIPSAREDRVWLGIFEPNSNAMLAAVREVTVTGEVTVPDTKPPGGRWPDAAVTDGLLFSTDAGAELLWDPLSRRALRRLPITHPGPSFGNLVASCERRCEALRLTDADTGASRTIAVPDGFDSFDPWDGAFSPGGSLLALPVKLQARANSEFALGLVDVRRGLVRVVVGSFVPSGYTLVAWSSSGEDVFLTGGKRFRKRVIVSYRLGFERAKPLDVSVGDFYGIASS